MTTLFGVKHPEVDVAVLVADRQTTTLNQQTGYPEGKFLRRKLWVGSEGDFCFGQSGGINQEVRDFLDEFSKGKFDLERVIKKGYFPELKRLNIKQMGRKLPDAGKLSGIILATRFDKKPKLYTCFPLGCVEERSWTIAGSGDQKINEYMNAMQVFSEAEEIGRAHV